jgi:hypothetical protein
MDLIAIMAANIQNAYLLTPTGVRHYIFAGLEFPPDLRGRLANIVRAALFGISYLERNSGTIYLLFFGIRSTRVVKRARMFR